MLKRNRYYRIPLGYLVSLGLISFAYQFDTRLIFTLETNLNKLFESNAKVTSIPDAPDPKIIFHDTPYSSYPQITLKDNFLIYYNRILRSRVALRMSVLFSPYEQSFEINTGVQSLKVDFKGLNAQIKWLEISLAYDKSNHKHLTLYNSYDAEIAAKSIKNITLENVAKTYSLTGKIKYDFSDAEEKFQIYQMFVVYFTNGSRMTPLTQYKNNPVNQDINRFEDSYKSTSDEKIYIDIQQRIYG